MLIENLFTPSECCFHSQETLTDLGLGHHRGLPITEWWERQAQLGFFVPLETQEAEDPYWLHGGEICKGSRITVHDAQLFDTAFGFLHWFMQGS